MRVHSQGLGGTQFIPVNVFEGELPLMLFSLPLRSKSISELSRPACHLGGTTLQSSPLPTRHLDSRGDGVGVAADVRERQSGGLAVLNLTYPLSGSLLLELIVNPIKDGNTGYWFTSLNTCNKQIQREYIMCKFTHKWLSRPQTIHIIYSSAQCAPIILVCWVKNSCSPLSLNLLQPL